MRACVSKSRVESRQSLDEVEYESRAGMSVLGPETRQKAFLAEIELSAQAQEARKHLQVSFFRSMSPSHVVVVLPDRE